MDILIVERIVIESLVEGPKNLLKLMSSTGLDMDLLKRVVEGLYQRDLLCVENDKYSLSLEGLSKIGEVNKDPDSIKMELQDIFVAFMNKYFKEEQGGAKNFALRKVYMNDYEEDLFSVMVNNLNSFVQDLEKKYKQRSDIKNKKVILWASSDYSAILNESLGRA